MSGWLTEEEDSAIEAGFGLSDMPRESQTDRPEPSDDADFDSDDDDAAPAEWTPSAGFTDGDNVVRLWADDDGNLTRVRVSLNWKEKLGEQTLDDAFNTAFFHLNAFYRATKFKFPTQAEPVTTTRKMSWTDLAYHTRRMREIDSRLAELPPGPDEIVEGQPTSANDYDEAVQLSLDVEGYVSGVRFDAEWLEHEARSKTIARAVMNCYRWAREDWRPPTKTLTERGKLAQQRKELQLETFAAMGNGIEGMYRR